MIDSLRRLPHNWDTYGSPPISEKALERMEVVLAIAICAGLEPESLVPLSGGGVQAEWHQRNSTLEFAVWPTGEIEYLLMGRFDVVVLEDETSEMDSDRIRRYVQQFMARKATRAAL